MLTTHETWMRLALQLAEAAEGQTSRIRWLGPSWSRTGKLSEPEPI